MTAPPPHRTPPHASAAAWLEQDGRLFFMRCSKCRHAFLPVREECPACLADQLITEEASGSARLVSWVVYRDPAAAMSGRSLPYTVAIVELTEGPRMISNIVGVADPETLRIDQSLALIFQHEEGRAIPRFTPADPDDHASA
jgi:uncharacterized OB-fold protein